MKKSIYIIFLLLAIQGLGMAQVFDGDSLKNELSIATNDTSRTMLMAELCQYYKWNKPDSALYYGNKAVALARRINFPKAELRALEGIVLTHLAIGNESKALQGNLEAFKIAEKNFDLENKIRFLHHFGSLYSHSKDYTKALSYFKESKNLADSLNSWFYVIAQSNMAKMFLKMNQPDSALYYGLLAYNNADKSRPIVTKSSVTKTLGIIYFEKKDYDMSLEKWRQALQMIQPATSVSQCYYYISKIYQKTGNLDSAIYNAKKSLEVAQESGIYSYIIDANILLSNVYENQDSKMALQFSKTAITYKDSLDDLRIQTGQEAYTAYDQQERQFEINQAKSEYQNRLRLYVFLGCTSILLLIAYFLYRNNKQKQKAKQEIEEAYDRLKSTQAQLIQSEKMASLGELTAGIAHEIQNPLNFVNNFSEVSEELVRELKEERLKTKDERDEALEDEILTDIEQNLQKINHHGNRASSIVKGMLEHSRTSSGKKELTDINALADEYLRLAYHGLRAKDKDFNAEMVTDFDPDLPKIEAIPQDIGRVLLNLINNSFQAVMEKASMPEAATEPSRSGLEGRVDEASRASVTSSYKPTVSVSTQLTAQSQLLITIKDNGPGIPDAIKDKIFQPFFTTKDTGKGTGLGLSLAYDIVKAHGGTLEVESQEREGTTFTIHLFKNI
jgi:two-component system NtrC family sensor kinase